MGRRLTDAAIVTGAMAFVFLQVHPDLVLSATTPAGGDMGAHVYAFGFLRDHLLPAGRLAGWSPDWYAGFPIFQFYMVIPFLGMVVLNAGWAGIGSVVPAVASLLVSARAAGASWTNRLVLAAVGAAAVAGTAVGAWRSWDGVAQAVILAVPAAAAVLAGAYGHGDKRRRLVALALVLVLGGVALPFGAAFKVVAVSGVVAMPLCGYLFARWAGLPHPTPALAAVAILGFLFDKNFTIYGGNIASTMAGEFAFSISLALSLAYLGALIRGLRFGTNRVTAAVLLALVGLCHLIPAFFALAATAVFALAHLAAEPRRGAEARSANGVVAVAVAALLAAGGIVVAIGPFTTGPVLAVTAVSTISVGLLWWSRRPIDPSGDEVPALAGRVRWLASVGTVAALLGAWWVLPFALRRTYLNDMGWEKIAVHRPGVPVWDWFVDDVWSVLVTGDLRVPAALALVGAVLSIVFRDRLGTAMVVLALGFATAFVYVPQGRLWNARLLPFWYLLVYLLAAIGVGEIIRALAQLSAPTAERRSSRLGPVAAIGVFLVVATVLGAQLRNLPGGRTNPDGSYRVFASLGVPGLFSLSMPDALSVDVRGRNFVTDWARWNFTGYERKDAYPEYRSIVTAMADVGAEHGCGRSLWEYAPELNDYGTPMALMLLPHWTDGCIGSMEGLYFEASTTTPFHFLMQSELSASPSRAQRDLPYRDLDLGPGVEHLQLMGVQYYLARSPAAIDAARKHLDLEEIAASGPWVVFAVTDAAPVEALRFEPAVTTGGESQHEWLCAGEDQFGRCSGPALDWFQQDGHDVYLAAAGPSDWQRVAPGGVPERRPLPAVEVRDVELGDSTIRFRVDRPGVPVVVKESYFPNWTVAGAAGPYRVSPNLMVVIPTDTEVELRHGRTPLDLGAAVLTVLGVLALVAVARRPAVRVRPVET